MDRGTIVIRHNDKGVLFEIFDKGERQKAEDRAQALVEGGEDPHICVNLQELKEAEDITDLIVTPMREKAKEMAKLIVDAIGAEKGEIVPFDADEWAIIVAALRRQL